LRNSLNVALPVTANFIDPLGRRSSKPLGSPGRDCGIRRNFTVAKGPQRHRINLARRIARQGNCHPSRRFEGMAASIGAGKTISLQAAVASFRKPDRCATAKVKYCICSSLRLDQAVPIFQSTLIKPGLFVATLSPDSFSRTFSVLLQTYPILRVFPGPVLLCSLPAWYENPAGKFNTC
jgi:hypothetical protein